MIQWKHITKKVESSAMAPPYYEITEALLPRMGFTKIDYPTIAVGSDIRYGPGGSYTITITNISVYQWNNIGLVLFRGNTNATAISLFYLKTDENGDYPEWYGPKELPAGNESYLEYDYTSSYFTNYYSIHQFISFYQENGYWYGTVSVYSNERFLFTERGNKSNGDIITATNNNGSDGDFNISLYHLADEENDISIILSCGLNSPITAPYQKIIEYEDITKPEAFPFLWITDERADYIALPGLYLLSFTMKTAEYTVESWGTWGYKTRRQGRKRLFKIMGDTFFYLNGKTAILP